MASAERFVAERLHPRRVALAAGAVMAVLVAFGVAQLVSSTSIAAVDYNGERNLPALLSSCLLALAGGSAALWAWESAPRSASRRSGALLAVLFLYMSGDELVQLHEKLEHYSGVDWQVLYVPVMAVAAYAALLALRASPTLGARVLLVAGGAGWVLGGLLEALEYDARDREVSGFEVMVFFEENFELVGALCFALAMLIAFRAVWTQRSSTIDAPPSSAPSSTSHRDHATTAP